MLSRATRAGALRPASVTSLHWQPWIRWIGAAAIASTYLGLLFRFPLSEPDEGRYAEIAREMIELGDWVTPHLNYVKYFEKPPLVYWLTAINFELFGMSELVVRLWPVLFGLVGICIAYLLARSTYGAWTGQLAAALLAATPLYFALSQFLILDMPLSALMALGLGSFWFAYRTAQHPRRFVLLLYAFTALAVLTKGPVAALLTAAIIVVFLILRRDLAALRWLVSPLGIVLFFLIAAPWFVLVSWRNPEFADFFFVKQHLGRFLTPDEHRQGPWFFIPIVLGGMLPWTAFALLAFGTLGGFASRLLRGRLAAGTLFCSVWSGVVFAFFSASGSKLGTYILPMFCPLAVLAARFFQQVIAEARTRLFVRACTFLLALAGLIVVGTIIASQVVDIPPVAVVLPRIYLSVAALAAASAAALVFARRDALHASLAILVGGMLLVQLVAINARSVASQYRPLGMFLRTHAAPHDRIALYRHYTQGVTFYGRRRVIMVGGRGELDFGSKQGDQRDYFWETDAQLINAWGSDQHLFLVINRSELEPLLPRLQPAPRQVTAHDKKVVIVNFP